MGAAVLLLLGVLTGAQAEEPRKDDKDSDFFRVVPIQLLQVLLVKSAHKTCDVENDRVCIIDMQTIAYGGRNYCLAMAPDLKVKLDRFGGFFNKKRLVWRLSTNTLDSKGLAFHPDSGIVVAVDDNHQIDRTGSYGDGSSGTADTYNIKTVRNDDTLPSSYLPVILWGPSGAEELCAAIDPRIVNVN